MVVLEHKVLVYNFADLRLLNSIETLSNQAGLLALSAEASNTVLACPGLHQGEVCLPALPLPAAVCLQQVSAALLGSKRAGHGL